MRTYRITCNCYIHYITPTYYISKYRQVISEPECVHHRIHTDNDSPQWCICSQYQRSHCTVHVTANTHKKRSSNLDLYDDLSVCTTKTTDTSKTVECSLHKYVYSVRGVETDLTLCWHLWISNKNILFSWHRCWLQVHDIATEAGQLDPHIQFFN